MSRNVFNMNPHPELWWLEEAGSQKLRGRQRNFCDPASFNHHNSGGSHSPSPFEQSDNDDNNEVDPVPLITHAEAKLQVLGLQCYFTEQGYDHAAHSLLESVQI